MRARAPALPVTSGLTQPEFETDPPEKTSDSRWRLAEARRPGSMDFFDYFQIASVAIVLLIFVGRASYLRFSRGINTIVIGGGKKGFSLAVEMIAAVGLVVWIIEVLLYALYSAFHIFPSPLDSQ